MTSTWLRRVSSPPHNNTHSPLTHTPTYTLTFKQSGIQILTPQQISKKFQEESAKSVTSPTSTSSSDKREQKKEEEKDEGKEEEEDEEEDEEEGSEEEQEERGQPVVVRKEGPAYSAATAHRGTQIVAEGLHLVCI